MIRMMGLVNLAPIGSPVGLKIDEAELSAKQKQLDVDKDGKIEGEDLAKLRSKKVDELSPPTSKNNLKPSNDHEVSMANNSLDSIIQHANDLKSKLGQEEKDIPAWIQDHITNAANYIQQAASNYHEYNTSDKDMEVDMCEGEGCAEMNEVAPEGWEKTVKAMKKHKEIDNPWALAYYMKSKGAKSRK